MKVGLFAIKLASLRPGYRLALALVVDSILAGAALQLGLLLFSSLYMDFTFWLSSAITFGALWILLSIGLYRDRSTYLGLGSRRKRLLGAVLVLVYATLVNVVAGGDILAGWPLLFSITFFFFLLGSRHIAKRFLTAADH